MEKIQEAKNPDPRSTTPRELAIKLKTASWTGVGGGIEPGGMEWHLGGATLASSNQPFRLQYPVLGAQGYKMPEHSGRSRSNN